MSSIWTGHFVSARCSPSAQVGQLEAIEEERIFGSSLTAEGAGDEIENRYAVGRCGEGGTRYKRGDPAAVRAFALSSGNPSSAIILRPLSAVASRYVSRQLESGARRESIPASAA